jgi:hypothetical protein
MDGHVCMCVRQYDDVCPVVRGVSVAGGASVGVDSEEEARSSGILMSLGDSCEVLVCCESKFRCRRQKAKG